MSVRVRTPHHHHPHPHQHHPAEPLASRFNEDAPRPPVPGEEDRDPVAPGNNNSGHHGRSPCQRGGGFYPAKGTCFRGEGASVAATPRRPDADLGYEPEGSASPTPPRLRWAESLRTLLDDRDGTRLFRAFLRQEECADLLDFWFACSGFRKLLPGAASAGSTEESSGNAVAGEKRLKLAKAIYRKYVVDGSGVVSRQIRPATRGSIRECVLRPRLLHAATFEEAQAEVQALLEENTYPLFLKSDVYLEYTRAAGGESPLPAKQPGDPGGSSPGSGADDDDKASPGYLPTLVEGREWEREEAERDEEDDAPASRLTQKLLMDTVPHRVAANRKYPDRQEFRLGSWREPVNPYYVNMGYAHAPATSANDSEQHSMSSDADTMSLTDSSVDGVPPYSSRKQHRREMHESAKANGRVPLPHIPRTYRLPKDIHVEPNKFASELISRLEAVLRERDAHERLEERLKRVRLEEEGDDADISMATSVSSGHYGGGSSRYPDAVPCNHDDPESILDDHVQRVMKTPGCQSPAAPVNHLKHTLHTHAHSAVAGGNSVARPREQLESEAVLRAHGAFAWNGETHHHGNKGRTYGDGLGATPGANPAEALSSKGSTLSRRGLKWRAEAGRLEEARPLEGPPQDQEQHHKILLWMMEGEKERHSSVGCKKAQVGEMVERSGAVHPWAGVPLRTSVQPSHPFIQDPTMPPNPAPNPLTQLEEARRRLEEERRRAAMLQAKQRHKSTKKPLCENVTVAYYFCGEPIPYRTSARGRVVTLGQFKELLTKKGSYRFYFKKVSDEFDCGVVFEEVREDDAILPIFEERIIGKVEKID